MPEKDYSIGAEYRGHDHYNYAVMLDGKVFVECGDDVEKAATIVKALARDLEIGELVKAAEAIANERRMWAGSEWSELTVPNKALKELDAAILAYKKVSQ